MGFLQTTYFQIAAIVVAVLLLLLLILLAQRRHRNATAEANLRPAATTEQQAMAGTLLGDVAAGEPLPAAPATPPTPAGQTLDDRYREPRTTPPVGADPLVAVLSSMIASSGPLTDRDFRRLAIYRPDRVLGAVDALTSTIGSDKQAAARLGKLAAVRQRLHAETTHAQETQPAAETSQAIPVPAQAAPAQHRPAEPEAVPDIPVTPEPEAVAPAEPLPEPVAEPAPETLLEVLPEPEVLPEVPALPQTEMEVLSEALPPAEPELKPELEPELEPEFEAVAEPELELEPEAVTLPLLQVEHAEAPIAGNLEPSTPQPPWVADTMPMIPVVERELPLEAWLDEPSEALAEPMPLAMWELPVDEDAAATGTEIPAAPEEREAPEPLPSPDPSFPIETGLTAQQFLALDNGRRASAIRHLSETELAKALHDSTDHAVKMQLVDRLEELGSSEALLALGEFLESPTSPDMQSYALGAAERLLNTHPER